MATSSFSLDVIVGELALVDGQRKSDSAHMALLTPTRRANADRRSETLLVFLDLGSSGGAGLAHAMLENLGRSYWRCSGTVTSALREAIGAANSHLREENRLLAVSQRRRAGLVCAVLHENLVYLAQIGSAKAFLAQGTQVTRIPAELRERLPLGVSTGLDIQFSHAYLDPRDRLLLTGEGWTKEIPDRALTATLRVGGAEEIMLGLERLAGNDPFSALIVEVAPLPDSARVPQPVHQEPLAPLIAPDLAAEPTAASGTDVGRHQMEAHASFPVGGVTDESLADSDHSEASWRPSKPLVGISLDRARIDRSRQGLRRVSAALGDGARTALTRVLPEPQRSPPRPSRQARGTATENVSMMAGIAVAIPLLVAFVVVTFYLQRNAVEQRESLVTRTRKAVEAARQADDASARDRWQEALDAAEEALLVVPDDTEINQVRLEARTKLDELGGVLRPELTMLVNLGMGGARQLAGSRMQMFILDPDQDQVTQHALDEPRESITGDQYSLVAYRDEPVGDVEIGELTDITWMAAGGAWTNDSLLILTDNNQVLQHSPLWGLRWVPFDAGSISSDARFLTPYDGRLYVLDPQQSHVWRIPATAEGFGPPERYFRTPPPDLSAAVDMTIDGAVYVMLADGQIYKFFGGEKQPYQVTGLPQPLARPVALVSEGDAASGALYVADAGAQSIVVLTKSGDFIYQFKAEGGALADLEAISIDEESRTLYVLASGNLYSLVLPRLPEQSNAE